MHQSKAVDNWKVFSDAENISQFEHRKIASVRFESRDFSVTRYRHEYLWDTQLIFRKSKKRHPTAQKTCFNKN